MKDYNKAKPVRRPYDKRPYFSREIASLSHQDSRPINSNRFFLAVTAIIQRGCGLVECGGDGWGAVDSWSVEGMGGGLVSIVQTRTTCGLKSFF